MKPTKRKAIYNARSKLRGCLDAKIFGIWLPEHFRLHLAISVQSYTNLAQKIRLVIYNQTVQLVICFIYI
jgi:hypothetical protein